MKRPNPLVPLRGACSAVLVSLVLASCQALEDRPEGFLESAKNTGHETNYLTGTGLDELQPADIALLPIRNQSANRSVPLEALRADFQNGLVERLYSPLDFAFVDAKEAAAPPGGAAAGPDATMVVAVTHWDPSRLTGSGVLAAAAEVRLYEGDGTHGPLIFGVALRRNIDLDPRQVGGAMMRDRLPEAIRRFAQEALALLPERDPLAAAR